MTAVSANRRERSSVRTLRSLRTASDKRLFFPLQKAQAQAALPDRSERADVAALSRGPSRREHGEHHAERDDTRVDDLYPRPPIGQYLRRLAGVAVGRGELGRQVQGDDLVGLLEQRLVDLKELAHGGRGGGGHDAPVSHLVVEEVVIYVDALPEHLVAEDNAEGNDRDAEVVGELLGQVGGAVGDDPNGQVALLLTGSISATAARLNQRRSFGACGIERRRRIQRATGTTGGFLRATGG